MNIASCGTIESNDCLITIKKNHETIIDIESIVYDQFKDQIEKVIRDTLKEMKMHHVHVHIQDKGALDYTIRARLITAIERMEESHA